ncbi:hypothetical protein BEP19_09120 [Ammoniphilus oxalaticus]|uniref:Thioredoxin domain-containing protein n=2 Tax=Ammoniphilus oxalaticus TaxID=66863 RepID=A0A419SKI8_9BACL|nr:hypothetical protein BEP19_09120 [Ammoniphilus oxalaticus]
MKKMGMFFLFVILCLTAVGCGSNADEDPTGNASDLFPRFETVDIDDQPVTDDIFAEHTLTLVNVWGTYCEPCKDELPALQKLSQEVEELNVGVVGLVSDGIGNNTIALRMLQEYGVTYLNIVPSDELNKQLISRLPGIPSSLFVNSKGEIVGDLVVGARAQEQFREMINQQLAEIR